MTDVENGGIASIESTGRLQALVKSPDVVWADGVKVTSDGWVIFTDSAIPAFIDELGRPPKKQDLDSAGPYQIYRFRAPRPPKASISEE